MKAILKRITAFICAAALLGTFTAVTAAERGAITYSFSGEEKDRAGYAEGKITLSLPDGKYKLLWADDNGALDGYYELDELRVSSGTASLSLPEHTAIPADATKLIACKPGTEPTVKNAAAVYDIPAEKRLPYSSDDINYSFMSYSDIHIDKATSPFYRHSELHWAKALEAAVSRNADFIVTSGDNITNAEGPGKEFDKFQEILAGSEYVNPIYESNGNHEMRCGEPKQALSIFASATGAGEKPWFSVEEKKSGDVFIFMALETDFNPNKADEFSDEQLDWFEETLDKYYGKDRNIFLVQHALIDRYGAGDNRDHRYYDGPLNLRHKSTQRFRDILESHKGIIWMSGHTHIAFKFGYNYSDNDGASCNMIHNSSVCCPTIINEGSQKLSYVASEGEDYEDFTEGYYVQVFDDEIIYNGENLYHDKIFPKSCYIMESCRKDFSPKKAKLSTPKPQGDLSVLIADAETELLFPRMRTLSGVTGADVAVARKNGEKLLSRLYTLSSYDCYQRLKKAVKRPSENVKAAYKELSEAFGEVMPYLHRGKVDVYFTDTADWKEVYANLSSAKIQGERKKLELVKKDGEGHGIYRLSVNRYLFTRLEFTDKTGEQVTDSQAVPAVNNTWYKLNAADIIPPYFCIEDTYINS